MKSAAITGITIYPIKSCGGIALSDSECTESGLLHDRTYVVVSDQGKVVTQRDAASMALIQPALTSDGIMTLQAPDMPALPVRSFAGSESLRPVEVWGDACLGIDQGDAAAEWLTTCLKRPVRLLKFSDQSERRTRQQLPDGSTSPITFTDACPLLVISEESLTILNERLAEPVAMSRFRPSLVINGLGPFGEDDSKVLQVNALTLHAAKPCARCVIVSIDQEQGVLTGNEPLQTLSTFRSPDQKVLFGYYFMPAGCGSLRVGDTVTA